MKTPHQRRVERMMKGYGQTVRDTPVLPNAEERVLRARLILEECLETINALGVSVYGLDDHYPADAEIEFDCLEFCANREPNLVEIADGCADISVVTIGTLSACGIPDEYLLQLVDENNLAKVAGGHRDEHGKFIKPEGHQPPDIEGLLARL